MDNRGAIACGDCESIAAVYVEVGDSPEWTAAGWTWEHVVMVYEDNTAHDVGFFHHPDGRTGWIDGDVHYGDRADMRAYYDSVGWYITDWWVVNDIGQFVRPI